MTLKDLLSVAYFGEIIVKQKRNKLIFNSGEGNELRFNLDKVMLENLSNIFAQEFLNLEVETVEPIDEYTLGVELKEKTKDE